LTYYQGDKIEKYKISGTYRTRGKGKVIHMQFHYRKTTWESNDQIER